LWLFGFAIWLLALSAIAFAAFIPYYPFPQAIWLLALSAIVSAAFIFYYPNLQKTDITITEPEKNATVSRKNDTYIKGTKRNLPTGYTIWIALFHKNTYYPLSHAPEIGQNDWSISYTFKYENPGETLEIVCLLVNAQAQKEIQAYLDKSKIDGYHGLKHIDGL